MQYLLVIYDDEKLLTQMTPEESAKLYPEHFLNEAQLKKQGEGKLRYMPGPPSVIDVPLNIGFVGRDDIRELARRGHVVGSHSCSHPLRMGHCSWPQLVDEWTRSREILEEILGAEVRVASVPGGDFAPQVAEAAAHAGIATLFTSEPTRGWRSAFGLTLAGRFTIQTWTSVSAVAGLAAGNWLPCARQALVWNAKKMTKRIGGDRYLQLRKLVLRHGNEVRWGDQN